MPPQTRQLCTEPTPSPFTRGRSSTEAFGDWVGEGGNCTKLHTPALSLRGAGCQCLLGHGGIYLNNPLAYGTTETDQHRGVTVIASEAGQHRFAWEPQPKPCRFSPTPTNWSPFTPSGEYHTTRYGGQCPSSSPSTPRMRSVSALSSSQGFGEPCRVPCPQTHLDVSRSSIGAAMCNSDTN